MGVGLKVLLTLVVVLLATSFSALIVGLFLDSVFLMSLGLKFLVVTSLTTAVGLMGEPWS
jgi:hypothetical protein